MAKIRLTIPNVGLDIEQLKLSYVVDGNVKFLIKLHIVLSSDPDISHIVKRNESLCLKKTC